MVAIHKGDKWQEGYKMYAYAPTVDGLHTPIERAFRATTAEPHELSYGDRDDTSKAPLRDMQLIQPEDQRSEYEVLWLSMLGEKLDKGWRLAYSDGCGRDNHNSYACHRENRRGEKKEATTGGYLGPISTVADSERRGVLEALQSDKDMLLILTDSMAAKATTINLSLGAPPRSQIEKDIKTALHRRNSLRLDTGISWVRAHIGIKGNELADQHATFQSFRGEIAGATRTATEGGIRRIAKEARASERTVETFGLGGRVLWGRRALAAYTWFRTGRGPQQQWLHKIGKAEDPSCPYGAIIQSGEHIVWHCTLHEYERAHNGITDTREGEWADLDTKIWVPNDDVEGLADSDDQQVDGVKRFFDYLAYQF